MAVVLFSKPEVRLYLNFFCIYNIFKKILRSLIFNLKTTFYSVLLGTSVRHQMYPSTQKFSFFSPYRVEKCLERGEKSLQH